MDGARRAREQRDKLAKVASELRMRRDASTGAKLAAIELCRRARSHFESERHHDPYGWVRPLDKVERLFELADVLGKPGPGERPDVVEETAEYTQLCEELGVEEAYRNPDQYVIKDIAAAVGAAPDTSRPPEGWPVDKPWLQEPKKWDPDQYHYEVVHRHLADAKALLFAGDGARLRLAWCIELALDTDRSALEHVLRVGGENETDLAGTTKEVFESFSPDGCSPLRWKLAYRAEWSTEFSDQDAQDRFDRAGEKDVDLANDLAETLTATEQANLDAHLLALAVELSDTFPEPGEAETRANEGLGGSEPPNDSGAQPGRIDTLGDAKHHMVTWNAFTVGLDLVGASWLYRAESRLPEPQWKAERCRPLYRLEQLLDLVEAVAPAEMFERNELLGRPVSAKLRRNLKSPRFIPKWAHRASTKPAWFEQ